MAMLTQKDALFNKKWSAYILSPSKCAWILVDIDKIIMKISLFVFYLDVALSIPHFFSFVFA